MSMQAGDKWQVPKLNCTYGSLEAKKSQRPEFSRKSHTDSSIHSSYFVCKGIAQVYSILCRVGHIQVPHYRLVFTIGHVLLVYTIAYIGWYSLLVIEAVAQYCWCTPLPIQAGSQSWLYRLLHNIAGVHHCLYRLVLTLGYIGLCTLQTVGADYCL